MLLTSLSATAETWSDTSIGWRYGTKFAEPFETNDIHKNIFNFTHVGGYKYGTNFFNMDLLMSDSKDPASCANIATTGCEGQAQEAYIVYRNTVDLSTEQVAFSENAVGYATSLSFLSARVDTITRAIKGE